MIDFKTPFNEFKSILREYDMLTVDVDSEDEYSLYTRHIMKNKKPLFFASTKINKRYVSFHLMPVYVFPDLLSQTSEQVKSAMQGKSCFNVKTYDETLFNELAALTQMGFATYQANGYV